MTEDQKKLLATPPSVDDLSHRTQGKMQLTYVEGWWVIAQMNAIFGPDGWSRQFVGEGLREADKAEVTKDNRVRHDVAMLCTYRVTVHRPSELPVTIEDVGYGAGQSYLGWADAYESAAKEAVTDALKRCCRSLGNALGNCLYDKKWLAQNAKGKAPPKNDNQTPLTGGGEPEF